MSLPVVRVVRSLSTSTSTFAVRRKGPSNPLDLLLQDLAPVQAKAERTIKAPFPVFTTAGEIATEFFELAGELGGEKGITSLDQELALFVADVENDQSRWQLETLHPFFEIEVKRQMIMRRVTALGASTLLLKLVLQLLEQGNIRRLRQVQLDFAAMMKAYRREFTVHLVTGKALDQARLDFYRQSIHTDHLQPGDTMIFSHQVDESILRGYRVVINGVEIDRTWDRAVAEHKAEHLSAQQSKTASYRSLSPSSSGLVDRTAKTAPSPSTLLGKHAARIIPRLPIEAIPVDAFGRPLVAAAEH